MGFSADKNVTKRGWNTLVEIDGASSLYLSDGESVTVSVNAESQVWQAFPIDFNSTKEELTDAYMRGPRYGSAVVQITDDDDYTLRDWMEQNHFGIGAAVRIWIAEQGSSNADLFFSGRVRQPRDASYDDEKKRLMLRITDRRLFENVEVPRVEISEDDVGWEHAASEWKGRQLPLLYGDWSRSALNEPVIEAIPKDTGVRNEKPNAADMKFVICEPNQYGIAEIDTDVRVVFADRSKADLLLDVSNMDLASAEFEVSTSECGAKGYEYSTGDKFYIFCKGNANSSGYLIDNPLVVWKDLLTQYADPKVPVDDLYNYSFTFIQFQEPLARAYIKDKIDLMDLVDQLCFEFNLLWGVRPVCSSGSWEIKYWISLYRPWVEASQMFDLPDYKARWGNLASEPEIKRNTEHTYCDRIRVKYKYNPRDDTYERARTLSLSKTRYQSLPVGESLTDKVIETQFIYRRFEAFCLVELQLLLYATKPLIYEVKAWGWPLNVSDIYLGKQIKIDGDKLDDTVVGIIQMLERNPEDGSAKLRLFDASSTLFYYGRWTSNDQDNWTASDLEDRAKWGFWTENDGNCDPLGTDSPHSNWV